MKAETCPCGRPVTGASLCADCTHTLAVDLADIAALHADLDTIRTRQTRYRAAAARTSGSGETPLPLDHRFTDRTATGSRLEDDTRNTVTTWVRLLADELPAAALRRHRPNTVPGCCRWLLAHLDRVRIAAWGPELADELGDVADRLRRFCDRPPDQWYAGKCGAQIEAVRCNEDLYAAVGDTTVTCHVCGTGYDLALRRAWLLDEAEERWETAAVIARAVTVWSDYARGENRLVERISKWASRSYGTSDQPLLQVRGHRLEHGRDRPLYRIGDVRELVQAEDARHARAAG